MAMSVLAAAAISAALGVGPGPGAETAPMTPPIQAEARPSVFTPVALSEEPARWRTQVCAGVIGLNQANGQYVVDRISQRAQEVGLRVAPSGCTANILVIFSADPNGQAQSIARERTDPASTTGRLANTEGVSALGDCLQTSRPVRWWRVTGEVTESGEPASRNERFGEPARVNVPERGRLGSTTFTAFSHVIVVVDLGQVDGLRLGALADYIAMAALTPLRPGERPEGPSVMGLFEAREAGRAMPEGLTSADRAYLDTIY